MTPSHQNARQRSRLDLKTVLETSRVLIEAKDVQFVLENLVRISMGKLLVSRAAILLYDDERSIYSVHAAKGSADLKKISTLTLNLDAEDLDQPHFQLKDLRDTSNKLNSLLPGGVLFNLRTSTSHLGFLVISQKFTQNDFTEEELEFVESLCIISSTAVANSRIIDQLNQANRKLDQRIHELNTLFDLSKEFNLLSNRDKISRIFKFALMGQLLIRSFFLIYRTGDGIEMLTSSNFSGASSPDILQKLFDSTEEITHVTEELGESIPSLKTSGICSLISISVQGRKIAVIGVGHRANEKPLTESDYNFLKSLANLAVNSIQRTYLLEERIEKERMEEELLLAKSIQNRLLPDPIPDVKGLDLSAITVSSYQVGGDYFDVAETPDGNHIFAIADVTGKGFPAALLMANLQSMLHILLPFDITLTLATERINDLIFANTPSDKFITFFWGKYHHNTRVFKYVNAGHNPPLLLRKGSDNFSELSEGGLLLGAMESMAPYESKDVTLEPGDLVVCFTDGVNEAQSEDMEEEFGMERLYEVIRNNRNERSSVIRDKIIKSVTEFAGGHQFDDVTLVIFKAH
ncbi:PP2C family protein-serine/threonine phosphatase [Rhodohalobacter sp. 8-1]|uniref:PP2C family protein-serine/threonine phosphatase n=1 Tax=Rhodohalobacter sp. 8-1 TaxID=3131972 RepID=UPI0030EC5B5C